MADLVLHGTGVPIIKVVMDTWIHQNTIKSVNGNTIDLNTAVNLADLDENYGLINVIVYTKTSADVDTTGVITGFSESGGDFLTVAGWSNGAPAVGKAVTLQDAYVTLPRCQRLVETFMPDMDLIPMISGRVQPRHYGYYYKATLDYSGYITKDQIVNMRHIFDTATGSLILYPRSDKSTVSYQVMLSPDVEMALTQNPFQQGHSLFKLDFVGIERLSGLPLNPSKV